MANHLKIIGEAYENFKDTNTSVSANKEPDSYRAMKRYFLNSEQRDKCKNASLVLGGIAHDVNEKSLVENISVEEAIADKKIQDKINSYVSIDMKDQMKFEFGIKFLKDICENHNKNIKELPDKKWKKEIEHIKWIEPINVPFRMYVDLTGDTYINDLKNKFPSVKLSPLKTKQTKENPNRIGDWVCSHPKLDARVFTSDLMQIALYSHTTGLKPSLSYASATDRILFTEDNCEELKPENLQRSLQELIVYEIAWEKKLKAANGSVEELLWLCPPDFSELRKGSFWWNGVPKKFMEDYLKTYV